MKLVRNFNDKQIVYVPSHTAGSLDCSFVFPIFISTTSIKKRKEKDKQRRKK